MVPRALPGRCRLGKVSFVRNTYADQYLDSSVTSVRIGIRTRNSDRSSEGCLVSDTRQLLFTDAEINQQALANASALPYLLVALAQDCGRTPEEAAAFAGRLLAPGWSRFSGLGADALVRQMALSLVCCGGEVEQLTGDESAAEAHVSGAPVDDEARFFGITTQDTDRFCSVFAPMADLLGFSFAWRRDGPLLVLSLSRTQR